MPDDYPADITTTGILAIDGFVEGMFEEVGDADWFRIEVDQYHSYEIRADQRTSIVTDVFDDQGRSVLTLFKTRYRFIAPTSGTYFVEARQPENRPDISNYVLRAHLFADDHTNYYNRRAIERPTDVDTGPIAAGVIEQEGDIDVFQGNFAKDITYTITVHGADTSDATLGNPVVRIFRLSRSRQELELIASDNNSGGGRSAQVVFTADQNYEPIRVRPLLIGVSAVSGTGTYRLDVEPQADDFPGNRTTPARLMYHANWEFPDLFTAAVLESPGDRDGFLISAKAGSWYNIKLLREAHPKLTIYDPDFNIVNTPDNWPHSGDFDTQGIFFAESDGDYLVVAESYGGVGVGVFRINLGHYRLWVDARKPFIDPVAEILNGVYVGTPIEFESMYEFDTYQLFAERHLRRLRVGEPPELLHPMTVINLSVQDDDRIFVPTGLRENYDVWIRAHEPRTDSFTSWKKIQATARPIGDSSNTRERLHVGTYAFAESLPAYFVGDPMIDGFEPLSESERQAFRDALAAWNIRESANPENSLKEIAPGPENDAAEVMLFKSNLTQDVYVVPNGWTSRNRANKQGDFIIDVDSTVMADLRPGGQGFFEMLRGVGRMIGTPENADPRDYSIMGQRFGVEFDHLPWATTPLAADLFRSTVFEDQPTYNGKPELYEILGNNPGDDKYRLRSGMRDYRSILDSGGSDWIIAAAANSSITISLLPNERSFTGTSNDPQMTFLIAYATEIENAVGGNYRDNISGNRFDNRLVGLAGNDVLNGRAGFDRLYGGPGNDRYIYEIGDQTNVINEQGQGGFDRLQVIGFDSFNSLEDMTFNRLGNDLLIRLRLDGDDQHIDDGIRIRNMGSAGSRVEQLNLDDIFGNNLANVSLVSIFNQATNNPKRFRLTDGSDAFGQLAVPIS